MQCANYITHYKLDAELFDYFEKQSGPDRDSARRIQEAVLREVDIRQRGYLLDVGSGNGWSAREPKLESFTKIYCDLSERNLKKILSANPKNSFAVVGDAHRLPFRENIFTHVIASEVIEHLQIPDEAVKEFYRVAKNKSRVIISTPYKEKIRTYLCIHCNKPSTVNAHVHSFDEKILRDMLSSTRFIRMKHRVIQNKIFITMRLSYIVRALPYPIWRMCDSFWMLFFKKGNTLIVAAEK